MLIKIFNPGNLPSEKPRLGRNQSGPAVVREIMRSIGKAWTASHLGFALMTLSPMLALAFGWEAFVPVALTSALGIAICILAQDMCTHTPVARLSSELLQDLVSADETRREAVLSELQETERLRFLAELPGHS